MTNVLMEPQQVVYVYVCLLPTGLWQCACSTTPEPTANGVDRHTLTAWH